MSRVGKKPISIPKGVKVKIDSNNYVHITGPKGKLSQWVDPVISVKLSDGKIILDKKNSNRRVDALYGLYRSLLANIVKGVLEEFEISLDIIGIGYKAEQRGRALVISVGYSHQIYFVPPEGVNVKVEPISTKVFAPGTPNQYLTAKLKVSGVDKQQVGQVAAKIRSIKPPDVYKSKGIRYSDERVHIKVGKAGI